MSKIYINKRIVSSLSVLLLTLLLLTACQSDPPNSADDSAAPINSEQTANSDAEQLYDDAVRDAVFAEDSEILPLVCLTEDDPMTTWNGKGQVLLLTFHKYPESYIAGEEYTTEYGEVWTFTDKEIAKWYGENEAEGIDWTLRFNQVIGVPTDKEYTHFSAMWVNPDDVKRPAYESDVTKQLSKAAFAEEVDPDFKAWFDGNIIWSYFDSAYPWTRLGYTYDWGSSDKEYGLSEFLIRKDATVTVEYTKTIDEFLTLLAQFE
jgi:hypothetical protein